MSNLSPKRLYKRGEYEGVPFEVMAKSLEFALLDALLVMPVHAAIGALTVNALDWARDNGESLEQLQLRFIARLRK